MNQGTHDELLTANGLYKNSMTFSLMILKLIYSFLYFIVLIFLLPFQYRKRPKDLRQRWLKEKFGFFNFQLSTLNSKLIWIHAVSVGEVIASLLYWKNLKSDTLQSV